MSETFSGFWLAASAGGFELATVHWKSAFSGDGQPMFETITCSTLCKASQLTIAPGATALSTNSCSWILLVAILETKDFEGKSQKFNLFNQ